MGRKGKLLINWCKENGDRGIDFWNGLLSCYDKNIKNGVDIYVVSASSHVKIYYKCINGHENYVRLDSVTSNGSWCNECKNKIRPKTRIKNQLEKGSKISFYDWCVHNSDIGKRCLDGFNRAYSNGYNQDIDINKIASGSQQEVFFICEYGHIFSTTLSSITSQNSWCKECYDKNRGVILREKGNETRIKSGKSKTLLTWCDENKDSGKLIEKAFMRCENINASDGIFINKELSKSNCYAYFKCGNKWHPKVYKRIADVTRHKAFCPLCATNNTSKPEQTVYIWCKSNFNNVTNMDRTMGKEADILIEDLKLVIEYQGEYYHRNKIDMDKEKKEYFESKGYKVLQIYEKTGRNFITSIINPGVIYHRYNKDSDCILLIDVLCEYFESFGIQIKNRHLTQEMIDKVNLILHYRDSV